MNRKTIVISTVIATLVVGGLFALSANQKLKFGKVAVEPIGDGKGVFIGEQRPQYKEGDPSMWSPETRKRVQEYERDVKAMDDAHKYTMMALNYRKSGRYDEAIQYHEKAYDTYPPGRSMVRIDLVETYELMGKYDDAIAIIDEMLKEGNVNEWGQKAAVAMKQKLQRKQKSQELPTDELGWPLRKDTGFKRIEGRWYPDIR